MKENLIGKTIGIYTILCERENRDKDNHKLYHVKCNICGKEFYKRFNDIHKTKECHHISVTGEYVDRYVWGNKRLGRIFRQMKTRCYNPSSFDYKWYGAKGIEICEEWMNNSEAFENWSISNGYNDNLTIDRKDESKNYSPDNCRWVTSLNNSKYKSTTRIIEVDGIEHTGREWPNFLNLGTNTINSMLRKYPEEQVKEFIRRRLTDLSKTRHPNQTWMDVYNL